MKKQTAGLAVAAAVGFTALAATPAMAVTLPFENCDAAAAVGVHNIPMGTPGYHPRLDRDNDGFGCDAAGTPAYDASIVAAIVAENTPAVPGPPSQMGQMPVGGVDTGVSQNVGNDIGTLALGGGLVLAAAASGTYLVRRRNVGRA